MARQFKSGVADSKDVRIIKRGSASINLKLSKGDWIPYAYGANLRGINVSGSSLQYAVFSYANLNNANFHKTEISQSRFISAKLSGANFSEVTALGVLFVSAEMSAIDFSESDLAGSNFAGGKLQNAKFVKANLIRANFNGADLSGANLQEAHLGAAVFHSTILSKTDFTKAKLGATIFADCDLYNCVGLEEVQHLGPSSIDTSTLLRTFKNGGCCFTPELQIFFMNTGLPKHVLDSTPQTLADIAYYSCFIAYGEPDKPFAERIRKDLVAKGISCWISLDFTVQIR